MNKAILHALAAPFVAGNPDIDEIKDRLTRLLGKNYRWISSLAERYVTHFGTTTRPRRREVVTFLLEDRGFQRAAAKYRDDLNVTTWIEEPQEMFERNGTWNMPRIETIGVLAAWLETSVEQLFWFADLSTLNFKTSSKKLAHYHYRALTKGNGVRLIESPKPNLKWLQRRILVDILEAVPAHSAVHGFVKGCSVRSFVTPHIHQHVVLRMDLKDFFLTISRARVQALFRYLGYPEKIADILGALCTNPTPRTVWPIRPAEIDRQVWYETQFLHTRAHLPQGAPTSPALANRCFYRTDCRLAGLARSAEAHYTRYADDLAFSGGHNFEKRVGRFSNHVAAILLEEGWNVHHRKTRIMHRGVRQHLAGVVVNDRVNLMRSDFDQLKAILTNCLRLGASTQNREGQADLQAHLNGRVTYLESINPQKGERLRRIFESISWA